MLKRHLFCYLALISAALILLSCQPETSIQSPSTKDLIQSRNASFVLQPVMQGLKVPWSMAQKVAMRSIRSKKGRITAGLRSPGEKNTKVVRLARD